MAKSPIVVAPQCRPDEECRPEPERRADGPPGRIPEEWHVFRRPEADTEDDRRILDWNVNVIRLDRLDHDVRRRPHIARARCRRDPPDPLLLARLQIAGSLCLVAQRLNRPLYVVGLGQKSLAELLGPVQSIVHHRQHLRDRRQSLDARIPRLVLHLIFERCALELWIFSDHRAAIATSSG